MTDPGPPPPPPPPDRPRSSVPPWGSPLWSGGPDNPRTYPARTRPAVDRDVLRHRAQRHDLEVEMARTGQQDAIVVADLDLVPLGAGRACTIATWTEGRITALPQADVVRLFALPTQVDGTPTEILVRADVAARVCATCWQPIPGLDPPRVITRRWPTPDELAVLEGLSLPPQPPSGG